MNDEITITLPLEDWTMIIGSLVFLERLDGHGRLKNLSERINGRIIHEMKKDSQEDKSDSGVDALKQNSAVAISHGMKNPDNIPLDNPMKDLIDKDYYRIEPCEHWTDSRKCKICEKEI